MGSAGNGIWYRKEPLVRENLMTHSESVRLNTKPVDDSDTTNEIKQSLFHVMCVCRLCLSVKRPDNIESKVSMDEYSLCKAEFPSLDCAEAIRAPDAKDLPMPPIRFFTGVLPPPPAHFKPNLAPKLAVVGRPKAPEKRHGECFT